MEGIAKTRVWGFSVASKIYTKTRLKMHHIFDDFWEPAGTHSAIQNHSKMHPESHRKFIDFCIAFCINVGIILWRKMLPNSHPKNYKILIDFWMIFSRFLEPKWEARGAQTGPRKGDKIEGKGETRSGSAQGTKMEPKWSQNRAKMDPECIKNWVYRP